MLSPASSKLQSGLLAALLLSLAMPAAAGDYQLAPSADAYVSNEYPNSNYGEEDKLFVHAGNNTKRSFLRFALPDLAPNEVIASAVLHLFFGQGGNAGTIIDLHHVATDNWDESVITWANKPAHEAAPLTSATTLLGNAEMTWNLPLTLFASDTDGGISLLLKLADETGSDTATFFSKEATVNPAAPPYLSLNTIPIPEPETWAMLLAGLSLVGWAIRKHKGVGHTIAPASLCRPTP